MLTDFHATQFLESTTGYVDGSHSQWLFAGIARLAVVSRNTPSMLALIQFLAV